MTNEEIKAEFARWIDSARHAVLVKYSNGTTWFLINSPQWESNNVYIVDGKHAELRKLQIDEPDTKFEVYNELKEEWEQVICYYWDVDAEYRVKPKEWHEDPSMVGKPIWVKNKDSKKWYIATFVCTEEENGIRAFVASEDCSDFYWDEAKPVTCDDLYKGK